jgi:hypothetical protein
MDFYEYGTEQLNCTKDWEILIISSSIICSTWTQLQKLINERGAYSQHTEFKYFARLCETQICQ